MAKEKKVGVEEIHDIISKEFKGKLHNLQVGMPDREYLLVSENKVQQVLRETNIDHRNYQSEVFDCDDFAFLLSAKFINRAVQDGRNVSYVFGRLWGLIEMNGRNVMHAVNWYANKRKKIKVIEPQKDAKIPMKNIKRVQYIYVP